MDEMVILESRAMRQQLCTDQNVCVLDRIGNLVILQGTDWATAEDVAAFFQVQLKTLHKIIERHKDEFVEDGYRVLSKKELKNVHDVHFEIPNRGLAIFPRRAILRLGMLLCDSVVAKLVRSYLLNAEEQLDMRSHDRQALMRMAQQLDRHAVQLIENADELKGHAERLCSQTRMITVIVNEIYRNRDKIQEVKTEVKANRERIIALEKLTEQNERKPEQEEEYITSEQIKILQGRVKEKGRPITVWARLKLHFGVTRYIFLPRERFREVLDWLETYRP